MVIVDRVTERLRHTVSARLNRVDVLGVLACVTDLLRIRNLLTVEADDRDPPIEGLGDGAHVVDPLNIRVRGIAVRRVDRPVAEVRRDVLISQLRESLLHLDLAGRLLARLLQLAGSALVGHHVQGAFVAPSNGDVLQDRLDLATRERPVHTGPLLALPTILRRARLPVGERAMSKIARDLQRDVDRNGEQRAVGPPNDGPHVEVLIEDRADRLAVRVVCDRLPALEVPVGAERRVHRVEELEDLRLAHAVRYVHEILDDAREHRFTAAE